LSASSLCNGGATMPQCREQCARQPYHRVDAQSRSTLHGVSISHVLVSRWTDSSSARYYGGGRKVTRWPRRSSSGGPSCPRPTVVSVVDDRTNQGELCSKHHSTPDCVYSRLLMRHSPTNMSATRILRPRVTRPYLSLRYQTLKRNESTTALPVASSTSPIPPSAPATPGLFRRHKRWVWVAMALGAGSLAGNFAVHFLAPPPMPEPGTRGDKILMGDLNKSIDEEFKVKVLRGKCLGVAKQLKGVPQGWVEIVPAVEAEAEGQVEQKSMRTALQGARGLGVERLFYDRGEQKLVAIIWFGGSVSGWPGVTHGGCIATQLSDKLALAAALAHETQNSGSAAAIPQRLPGTGNHAKMPFPATMPDEPAQLSLSYVKPTYANSFYVIRVGPAAPIYDEPSHIVPPEPAGGHEYEATLETMTGQVCVKAKGSFKPSSVVQRIESQVVEAVGDANKSFREWMWPSRQKNSA
jgi:hypothetical protein